MVLWVESEDKLVALAGIDVGRIEDQAALADVDRDLFRVGR